MVVMGIGAFLKGIGTEKRKLPGEKVAMRVVTIVRNEMLKENK